MNTDRDQLNILAPRAIKPKFDYLHREVQRAAGRPLTRRQALGLGGMALFAAACGSTAHDAIRLLGEQLEQLGERPGRQAAREPPGDLQLVGVRRPLDVHEVQEAARRGEGRDDHPRDLLLQQRRAAGQAARRRHVVRHHRAQPERRRRADRGEEPDGAWTRRCCPTSRTSTRRSSSRRTTRPATTTSSRTSASRCSSSTTRS